MVLFMRIDTSNLLLAAQVQARPAVAVKPTQTAAFRPEPFAAESTTSSKAAANPGTKRLGQKLDIKI